MPRNLDRYELATRCNYVILALLPVLRLTVLRACLLGNIMSNGNSPSLAELEQRIAIARDNIRQLIEQAAAFSGAEDEDRNADRIAQQQEELERLIKQRDALAKKK
jgi:hypothetical protein